MPPKKAAASQKKAAPKKAAPKAAPKKAAAVAVPVMVVHRPRGARGQRGGNWFDDFKTGFMLPVTAASTLAKAII